MDTGGGRGYFPFDAVIHGGSPRAGGLGVLFMHEVHKVRGRFEDDFEAAFRQGWMSYRRREAMLWQKIEDSNNYAALVHLLTNEVAPEHRAPGSSMVEALKYRDHWESRLLRTSAWSPLY